MIAGAPTVSVVPVEHAAVGVGSPSVQYATGFASTWMLTSMRARIVIRAERGAAGIGSLIVCSVAACEPVLATRDGVFHVAPGIAFGLALGG